MSVQRWLQERRRSWKPVRTTRAGMLFWVGLLALFLVLTVLEARLAFAPGSPRHVREGIVLNLGLILVCLSGIALRTRFQLTARLLSLSVFLVVGLFFYLRYAS